MFVEIRVKSGLKRLQANEDSVPSNTNAPDD